MNLKNKKDRRIFKSAIMTITFFFCFLFTNCATILSDSHQRIILESSPPDANVYINGEYYGRTPLMAVLSKSFSYSVIFTKYGYYNSNLHINRNIDATWLILDIVGGIIPIAIDAVTENWYTLDPTLLQSELQRWP
jgi:hypothetical protein